MKQLVARGSRRWRSRRAVALGVAALAVGMAVPCVASADYWLSPAEARAAARDYVSNHYDDTYASDLWVRCVPSGGSYVPGYVYHRYRCRWYDESDDTRGVVLITGSRASGLSWGRVLVDAY
jgi:hypothetical protein